MRPVTTATSSVGLSALAAYAQRQTRRYADSDVLPAPQRQLPLRKLASVMQQLRYVTNVYCQYNVDGYANALQNRWFRTLPLQT